MEAHTEVGIATQTLQILSANRAPPVVRCRGSQQGGWNLSGRTQSDTAEQLAQYICHHLHEYTIGLIMTTSNWKRWNMLDWNSNYKRVCQAIYIPTVYTLDLSSHNIGNCLIDAVIFSLRCHLNNGDVEGVLRRLWQRRIKATWMLAGILCVINSTSCHQGIRVHDHPCYPYLPSSTIPSLGLMLACIIECSFTLSGFL